MTTRSARFGLLMCSFALASLLVSLPAALAQGTVPTFQHPFGVSSLTLVGHDPSKGGTTTIPVELVAVTLNFPAQKAASGRTYSLAATPDVAKLERSPIFSNFNFPTGGNTQYADALLRSTFPNARNWHTRLAKPRVRSIRITIPAGSGYVLTSKRNGGDIAVVDLDYVQQQVFRQVAKQPGALVLAVTHNATFYALGDATVCCSWGTHGVDAATGNSFVLASYLDHAADPVSDQDVQPISQQLAEFMNDPQHDPLARPRRGAKAPGNNVPSWRIPNQTQGCGSGIATTYFSLLPTSTNPKNNFPASVAYVAHVGSAAYHLENTPTLNWYTSTPAASYSFPATHALPQPAQPCPSYGAGSPKAPSAPTVAALPESHGTHGHALIGYWVGYRSAKDSLPMREISPQWDIIIVAFAQPNHQAAEGSFQFAPPAGMSDAEFKAGIGYLHQHNKKVLISLGGGGQTVTLDSPASVAVFDASVGQIVSDYGFDGVDIDFESPSMSLQPGDNDYRHPTTPSIVHLITALHDLHRRFGPGFMVSLVPEGSQIPGGYPAYGGQFGSYLPLTYGLRDILSFVDVQNYNTPPLQALDGNIYQVGSQDYYTSMTELLLHGFDVGGNPAHPFPAVPASKVAIGFINGQPLGQIRQAMSYLLTGNRPADAQYTLRKPTAYPDLLGAMLWTINGDYRDNYEFSNLIGPELHNSQAARSASASGAR